MLNSNMVNFLHQKAFIVGQMANLVNRCVSTKEIPKFSYEKSMSGTNSWSITEQQTYDSSKNNKKNWVYVLELVACLLMHIKYNGVALYNV